MLQNVFSQLQNNHKNVKRFNNFKHVTTGDLLAEEEKEKATDFHKALKNLCMINDEQTPDLKNFQNLKQFTHLKKYDFINDSNDLLCRTYKNGNKIVIVFQCAFPNFTLEDINAHLLRGWAIPQFKEAYEYYAELKQDYPKCSFFLTGYDIGGSVAQFVGLYNKEAKTVTFNALGLGRLYPQICGAYRIANITNYVSARAPKMLREKHLGEVRMVFLTQPDNSVKDKYSTHILNDFRNLQFFKVTCNSIA